jgi:DHA2 family multidrug resistance protein
LGYPAFEAGLILAPRAFTLFLMMPVAGLLYRYIDARVMIAVGTTVLVWSYWDLASLNLNAGFWTLVPMLLLMGAGMPFMFVTVSTLALSSMDRRDMTDASSLYTLARRIGGNVGYALTATLVARGIQTSRATLVHNVTPLHSIYRQYYEGALQTMQHAGVAAAAAGERALALINHMVNQQATMLAYNKVSLTMGLMTAATIPLVLFLPGSGKKTPRGGGGH